MKISLVPWVPPVLCALGPFLTVWALHSFLAGDNIEPSVTESVHERVDHSKAFLQRRQREARDRAFQSQVRESFSNAAGADSLIEQVRKIRPEDIGLLTTAWDDFVAEDREAAVEWLENLTDGLCELGAHNVALDITSYIQGKREIPDIERRIFYDLTSDNFTPVLERFTLQVAESGFIDTRQVSIATSLALNERSASKDQFMSWVKSLSDHPERHRLQVTALRHLVGNAEPGSADQAATYALVEETIGQREVSTHLPELALQYAPGDPAKTFEWVSQLATDDQEMREQAYAQVMQQSVFDGGEKAAEVLSSNTFLDTTYSALTGESPFAEDGNVQTAAGEFYDRVLAAFMDGMVSVDPYLVLESADAFFSPELARTYKSLAREVLVDASSLAEVSGHPCGDPRCDKTH